MLVLVERPQGTEEDLGCQVLRCIAVTGADEGVGIDAIKECLVEGGELAPVPVGLLDQQPIVCRVVRTTPRVRGFMGKNRDGRARLREIVGRLDPNKRIATLSVLWRVCL
jgi:hypothetical protein